MSTEAWDIAESVLDEIGMMCEADAPLGPLTWYGVGGRAEALARPATIEQLAELVRRCAAAGLPVRVLGKGANLLVADGVVGGVVVLLDSPAFRAIKVDAAGARVTAGGGADLERAITASVREGLAGLEVLAGIPATVGGAIRMNAGGAFGEIGGTVASVTVIEPDGALRTLGRGELEFGYRRSNLGERIVAAAEFALAPVADRGALRERLKEVMAYKKHSQPMAESSAGCAFKNPRGAGDKGAGRLIDEAGLKGLRIGGAEVSPVHANFIVVHPGATATDVLRLMEEVRRIVAARCGIELEREVVVWGAS